MKQGRSVFGSALLFVFRRRHKSSTPHRGRCGAGRKVSSREYVGSDSRAKIYRSARGRSRSERNSVCGPRSDWGEPSISGGRSFGGDRPTIYSRSKSRAEGDFFSGNSLQSLSCSEFTKRNHSLRMLAPDPGSSLGLQLLQGSGVDSTTEESGAEPLASIE